METQDTRVLIIDDEAGLRRNLRFGLTQHGFAIDDVEEGLPALRMIEESYTTGNPYKYVVTDINLPDINGLKLLEVIKSKYPELPVVIISGYGDEITSDMVEKKRGDGYLAKPFMVDELTHAFSSIPDSQVEPPKGPATELATKTVSAYCLIKIKDGADMMGVYQKLYFMDNVLYCDAVRDAYDIAVLLNGTSYRELERVVQTKIKPLDDIAEIDYTPVVRPHIDPQVDDFLKFYDSQHSTDPTEVKPTPSGDFMSAYILVEVDRNLIDSVYPRLQLLDEVVSCDATEGKFDVVLLVKSASYTHLKRFIADSIRPMEGIIRTKTLMVIRLFDM